MKTVLICVGVLLVLVYMLGAEKKDERPRTTATQEPPTAPVAPKEPPIPVTSSQLFADYDGNEVSADDHYKNRSLLVTGAIRSIDKDFMDKMILRLAGGRSSFETVDAEMVDSEKQTVSGLHKGAIVAVACVGHGMIVRSPMLHECRVHSVVMQ